jgi:hypothetical protein
VSCIDLARNEAPVPNACTAQVGHRLGYIHEAQVERDWARGRQLRLDIRLSWLGMQLWFAR